MSYQSNGVEVKESPRALASKTATATGGSCSVSASYAGSPTTDVKENDQYWLNFSGVNTTRLEFIVTLNSSAVTRTQTQSFYFSGGYSGSTTTPFGIPNWGGNPNLGPAQLTVIYDGGSCIYKFNVVS